MNTGDSSTAPRRAYGLDAMRGLAILGMILSGQLPFGNHALPSWMYHAQVPPPDHRWIGTLAGITWVDLVFPFFLFSLGASIPLALTRRLSQPDAVRKTTCFILERGLLLGFFALYVEAIRPYIISEHPTTVTWLLALLGFALLFPIYTRLPEKWPVALRAGIRAAGWIGAILLLAFLRYPGDKKFALDRSDIIIIVLTNMAVFGSFLWWLTRNQLLLRLGALGILVAIRLSNMPHRLDGWVGDIWQWSPVPWLYRLYYLQYLFIVVPGTIAGDLMLAWMRGTSAFKNEMPAAPRAWSAQRYLAIALLMIGFVVLLVAGLKARWLVGTTLATFALCALGWRLFSRPLNDTEQLFRELFKWAIYWLVLGLFFEPYEGGIKKDKATMSYYFVTSGLAICVFIAFTIMIDVFRRKRWVQLLIENGQNPMIAYAGINNLIIPLLGITTASVYLAPLDNSPWLGFVHAAIITLLLALSTSVCTKLKIFWRT